MLSLKAEKSTRTRSDPKFDPPGYEIDLIEASASLAAVLGSTPLFYPRLFLY